MAPPPGQAAAARQTKESRARHFGALQGEGVGGGLGRSGGGQVLPPDASGDADNNPEDLEGGSGVDGLVGRVGGLEEVFAVGALG